MGLFGVEREDKREERKSLLARLWDLIGMLFGAGNEIRDPRAEEGRKEIQTVVERGISMVYFVW